MSDSEPFATRLPWQLSAGLDCEQSELSPRALELLELLT